MGLLLSRSFCRFLAAILLVLDLGQEPLSALPSSAPDDGDTMVTEIATHEEFWWGSPARPSPELHVARAAEHASPSPGGLPPLKASQIAAAVAGAAIAAGPDRPSAPPAHLACPEPPPAGTVFAAAFSAPLHRSSFLDHRASVLLLI